MSGLSDANAARWARAKVNPNKRAVFKSVAERLAAPAAKARYAGIEKRTGVPWFAISVIHEREASQSWAANIAQGDPWNKTSTHVPAGRGPFKNWDDAAVDALMNCAPFAGKWKDWSVGGTLELLERYNGLGYASKKVPSPYIWSGTDQYVSGKYIRDHVYDASAVDQQLGCAGLLIAMQEIDPSIKLGSSATAPPKPKAKADTATAGGIIVAGGVAAKQAHDAGHSLGWVALIALAVVVVAVAAFLAVRLLKRKA